MARERAGVIDVGGFLGQQLARRAEPRERCGWFQSKRRILEFADAVGAEVVTGGWTPAYYINEDLVSMPPASAYWLRRVFLLQATFASELAHELQHWAGGGGDRRLARPRHREAFDYLYKHEELIADIGSVLLCFDLGISRSASLQHARYLQHFLGSLPNPQIELQSAYAAANQSTAFLMAKARGG